MRRVPGPSCFPRALEMSGMDFHDHAILCVRSRTKPQGEGGDKGTQCCEG